jgi:hypothetical protein
MDILNSYKATVFKCIIFIVHCKLAIIILGTLLFVLLIIVPFKKTNAQYAFDVENENAFLAYDELLVSVYLDANWSFNTHVIITNTDSLYINIEDIFINLEIPNTLSNNGNSISGFIENENNPYSIDFSTKEIKVGKRIIPLQQELVKEAGSLYLESSVLADAFGLNLTFNKRSLTANLKCDFELPKTKQKKLVQTRKNISKLRGEQIAVDTVIKRDYHLFRAGMLDWGLASYQTSNEQTNNYVRVGVGAELFYGEVNASVNYFDKYEFDIRQLQYSWRWIDNDKKIVKQAQLGNIFNQTIASLNFPVIGANIRNSPTTIRKASGHYIINEYTEPNWTVELYINDILVDYTTADASGLYVFKVPNVYGYTTLKLKFYGPLGEERTEERTVHVPYTFMPAKIFEYGLSGGILQDGNRSRFGRADFNYGVTSHLTVGGGVEYLSSIYNSPYIPFVDVAFQPFSKLVLNLEYAHDVRMRGLLNFYFTQSAFLEIDYAKYEEGQLAKQFTALEERKAKVSVPFKIKKVSGFAKINFNQFIYEAFTYNQFDFIFSAHYKQFSANTSSQFNWVNDNSVFNSTDLSLSYKMKNGILFRPSVQYNLIENNFMRVRAEIEKRVYKAYFSVSYERNISAQNNTVYFSFRYDLPFARTSVSISHSNNKARFSESAQGSLAFGGDNNYIKASNNSSLGKGGIMFYPFLDLNNNGNLDEGEKMIMLNSVKISGGRAYISEKDSIVRVSNLNAFVNYNVEFLDSDLDNIAWRFKHKTYQVLVDPNQYKRVYVPIISVGEISGMVYLNGNDNLKGIGRITIQIYNKQGNKVAETLSERDGYYSYLGLSPDNYVVRIDEEQLEKLDYQSKPVIHNVIINKSVEGDILDGLDFVLKTKEITGAVSAVKKELTTFIETKSNTEQIKIVKIDNETIAGSPTANDTIEVITLIEEKGVSNFTQKSAPTNTIVKSTEIIKDSENIDLGYQKKTSNNINPSFSKLSDITGFLYSVQIGVYKNYITAKQLKNLTPIYYETLPNGNNRYFTGNYNSVEDAENARKTIVAKGIKGAYVVNISKNIQPTTNITKPNNSSEKVVDKNIADGSDFIVTKMNN